jgi:tRNA/rRNA methyltransferase
LTVVSELVPPCVILSAPQMAENIGAVARSMANFGLSELRLVNPRDGWPQRKAWASSSGAHWPLDGARVFERLDDAVADLQLVHATTARPREMTMPVMTPRASSAALAEAAAAGLRTGLLFGGERAGLNTEEIALAHAIVTVPVDPRFASLNLAQAVAVNAYEWWTSRSDAPPPAFPPSAPPAQQSAVLGLYEHLERELDASGFLFPPENRPSMVRNLRVMLGRARFTEGEVRTLRGVISSLSRGRGRTLARLAQAASGEPD